MTVSDKRNSTSRSFKIDILEDTSGRVFWGRVIVWAERLREEVRSQARCRVFWGVKGIEHPSTSCPEAWELQCPIAGHARTSWWNREESLSGPWFLVLGTTFHGWIHSRLWKEKWLSLPRSDSLQTPKPGAHCSQRDTFLIVVLAFKVLDVQPTYPSELTWGTQCPMGPVFNPACCWTPL